MKIATIKGVLEERQKEIEKYLKRFEKEQRNMRKEKHLGHTPDMLETMAHQVGYMTGALEQSKQLLEMFAITDKEFSDRIKRSKESLRLLREQLRSISKRAKKKSK